MEGMRAWLHITSQLTARTGVVYFASHRTILYAPSTASYIRFVLRARTHSTDSLRPSSPCRVSVHSGTCSVRRSVVGAHAQAHALHPCTVCPRACRDKGSRVLGSWACKCTRLNSRRLRSRTRNGRVLASAGLRGHKLRLFETSAGADHTATLPRHCTSKGSRIPRRPYEQSCPPTTSHGRLALLQRLVRHSPYKP